MSRSSDQTELLLKGAPIGSGIAIGRPFCLQSALWKSEGALQQGRVGSSEEELARYHTALGACRKELAALRKSLEREGAAEGAAIIESQLQLLEDPLLTTEIEEQISQAEDNAEAVFLAQIKVYEARFAEIPDPFFRERFLDIEDIAHRIVAHLRHRHPCSTVNVPADSIVVAENISPSDAAEASRTAVLGFVTTAVGAASHTAIVAKAKGIPYVGGIDLSGIDFSTIESLVVDGQQGQVILNPTPLTIAHYKSLQHELSTHQSALQAASRLPAQTEDGVSIRLAGNVECPSELEQLHRFGAMGIGLYRSEYLPLTMKRLPNEEEQYAIYRELVEGAGDNAVVIRTFDIGADKSWEGDGVASKGDALGCRAIRVFLREPEIFKTQLRAILRASTHGTVRVLFPMISGLSELRACKALLAEAREELRGGGIETKEVPVGCMIEVPAAALICDLLAKECDFLSIGTNDLVQYILAIDRESASGDFLYRPTAPAIIRTIRMIVREAAKFDVDVTVCGEVAADPNFTPLLLGLGVRALSVAPRHLPGIKHVIRQMTIEEAEAIAQEALGLSTAKEIHQLLMETQTRAGGPKKRRMGRATRRPSVLRKSR